jgi:2-succinyl-6-hydroxy-2,4-cyclohexadiene-1-carboxylate synthase
VRIFVHGFTQTASSWDEVRALLPDHASVAVEVPDRLAFVETAAALAIEGGSGEWVGYSMGARLCLQVALDHRARVERLVLVSGSPGIADPAERAARARADDELARSVERDGVGAFLERWLEQSMFATLTRRRAGLAERAAGNTAGRIACQLRALGQGAQPSNWARLAELRIPVLVVAGERDAKYVELAHAMASTITGARVEIVPNAGHACHLEQPEAIAHLLSSW